MHWPLARPRRLAPLYISSFEVAMKRAFTTLMWVLITLVALDVLIALLLSGPAPDALKRYFDYGRSVPGKIAQWKARPDMPGNLLNVAWLPEMMQISNKRAALRPTTNEPVLHAYGMSFVNDIMGAAQKARPDIQVELLSGPGAPPNFTYAAFMKDRPNRRKRDIVVLGILSSSVSAMGSFTNSTWVFEQPSPFTYPVFRPDADGGLAVEYPELQTLSQQLSMTDQPNIEKRWMTQLRTHDLIFTPTAFDLPILDISPFARLVRRALAQSSIAKRKRAVIAHPEGGPMPYLVVLRRMIEGFNRTARFDGQIPIVVLVQSNLQGDPRLKTLLEPFLVANEYPYFATETYQDPKDFHGFLGDGHYSLEVNARFGRELLNVIDNITK